MEGSDSSKETTVILVHPSEIIRHALASLLKQSGYRIALLATSCDSLLKQLGSIKPDLILIHYSEYKSPGIIKQIIDKSGAYLALLASSDSYHQDIYKDMLDQVAEGVTGFLDMDEQLHTFLSELDGVNSGDMVVSRNFVKHLSQRTTGIKEKLNEFLSHREVEVLNLLGKGNTNKEIGQELFISEHTVKVHLRNILTKLNLENRQQAIAYAIRRTLMDDKSAGGK
jgi:DNA-binding NarL/FixJ family response regulator